MGLHTVQEGCPRKESNHEHCGYLYVVYALIIRPPGCLYCFIIEYIVNYFRILKDQYVGSTAI